MLGIFDSLKTDDNFENSIKKQSDSLCKIIFVVKELAVYNSFGHLDDCDAVQSSEWRNSTNYTSRRK